MSQEIEIKLRIIDLQAVRRALKKLRARPIVPAPGRVHEMNVLFDTPQGDLARHAHLLRIRTETPVALPAAKSTIRKRIIVTFKRPVQPKARNTAGATVTERHKVREEVELVIADASAMTKIFEALGMPLWFRYEKFRTTYRLPASLSWAKGLLIELDETPVGTFLELEGPPKAIDHAAKALGFSRRDYLLATYLGLYLGKCKRDGKKPGHMLFQKEK